MDLIENRIDEYLDDQIVDEGLGRIMKAGLNTIARIMYDRNLRKAAGKSLETIENIMRKNDRGELQPNYKKQLQLLNKKLEFYKEEFVKVLMKIEKLAEEAEKAEEEEMERSKEEREKYGRK